MSISFDKYLPEELVHRPHNNEAFRFFLPDLQMDPSLVIPPTSLSRRHAGGGAAYQPRSAATAFDDHDDDCSVPAVDQFTFGRSGVAWFRPG